jgi:uncharacterized protein YneF (UPF0154 family)
MVVGISMILAIALLCLIMGCLIGIEIVWRRINRIKKEIVEEAVQKLKSEVTIKDSKGPSS